MSHQIRTEAGNRVYGLVLTDRGDEIEEADILAIEAEAAPGLALTAEALDRIIELLMPKPWGDSAQGGRRWADVDEALGVAQSARSIRLAPAAAEPADPAEVLTAMATSDALNAVRAWGGFRRMPVAIRDAVNRAWSRAYRAAHPAPEEQRDE